MLRKIILHGRLSKLCPEPVMVDAATAAEAVRGLCVVTNGAFNPTPGRGRWSVSVVGYPTQESLFSPLEDEVKELHIFPAFVGGKSGGVMQIIVGAVLIVAAVAAVVYTGGMAAAAKVPALWGLTTVGAMAAGVAVSGAMMMLGGMIALMSPTPKLDTGGFVANSGSNASDPEASRYLGSTQNTVKAGTRIPILYGRTRVYGQILSLGLQAKDVAV